MQVLDHGIEVEALEFLRIVERLVHWIGQGGVLVENLHVQLVRPPVTVRVYAGSARDRALAFSLPCSLRSCSALSRFVYKYHHSLKSDPASWPSTHRIRGCAREVVAVTAVGIEMDQGHSRAVRWCLGPVGHPFWCSVRYRRRGKISAAARQFLVVIPPKPRRTAARARQLRPSPLQRRRRASHQPPGRHPGSQRFPVPTGRPAATDNGS